MNISTPILSLVVCKDCRHMAQDEERHKQHMKEARHVHCYRNLAYRWWNNKISCVKVKIFDKFNVLPITGSLKRGQYG